MATTTEEFLVKIGLDPKSVNDLVRQIEAAREKASNAPPVTIPVTTDADQAADKLAGAASAAGAAGDEMGKDFDEGLKLAKEGAEELKTTLLALTAATALVGGLALREAAQESRNLARANVILGLSTEELAKSQSDLRQVADAVGLSYADVSNVLFDVASAGFQGQKAIEATIASAKAAVPAGVDIRDAFNAIATAQTNFKISSEEAADTLVRTADITRGTLADVASAIGKIGPVASGAGISLEEVGAGFAQITNRGEAAEVASTLLFNAINAFLGPAEEAKKSLQAIGITTGDAAFSTQSLSEKLELLKKASDEGRISLSNTFNLRAFRGISALLSDTEEFATNIDNIKDSAGRTQQGLDDFFQSAGPQWDLLKTQVINTATAVGVDLLEALQPTIESARDFIAENRELLKVLAKLTLAAGAITAAWLTYRAIVFQVNAVTKVLTGLTKANTAVQAVSTGGVIANTKAWIANLTAQEGAAASPIGKALKAVIGILTTQTGVVLKNAEAWAGRFLLAVGDSIIAVYKFIVATVRSIAQITLQTLGLQKNTIAQEANNASRAGAASGLSKLTSVLRTNVSALSTGTVAAGVLGAAMAGWALGRKIDEWAGLTTATKAYASGVGTTTDAIKANIATLGLASLITADARAEVAALNVLTEQQTEYLKATPGAMDAYSASLKRGLTVSEAFNAALGNNRAELAALNRIIEKGNASADVLARRAELLALERDRLAEQNEKRQQAINLANALKNAQTILLKQAEDWESLTERVNKAYANIQVGGFADILELNEQFDDDFTTLKERFEVFVAELVAIEKQREELQSRTGDGVDAALKQNAASLETTTRRIAEVRETLTKAIEITRQKIVQTLDEEVSEVRAKGAQELEAFRSLADKEIETERAKVTAIEAEVDRLKDIRDESISATEGFIRRLESAELRRRDTQLADIVQLERDYNKAIQDGIATEEDRTRALELLNNELARLAQNSDTATRAQEDLVEVQKRIGEVTAQRDTAIKETQEEIKKSQDLADKKAGLTRIEEIRKNANAEINQLLEEQKALEATIAEEASKRAQREGEAQRILAGARDASEAALAAFQAREQEIKRLNEEKVKLNANVAASVAKVKVEEERITAEIKKQVTALTEFAQKQLEVANSAKKVFNVIEQGRGLKFSELKNQAQAAVEEYQGALRQAQESTQQALVEQSGIEEQIRQIATVSTETKDWITDLRSQFTQVSAVIDENGNAIVPAAQELTQAFASLDAKLLPSQDAVANMLEATKQFAPQFETLAGAMVDKLGGVARQMNTTTARLATLETEVRRIRTGGSGGGANGLPN